MFFTWSNNFWIDKYKLYTDHRCFNHLAAHYYYALKNVSSEESVCSPCQLSMLCTWKLIFISQILRCLIFIKIVLLVWEQFSQSFFVRFLFFTSILVFFLIDHIFSLNFFYFLCAQATDPNSSILCSTHHFRMHKSMHTNLSYSWPQNRFQEVDKIRLTQKYTPSVSDWETFQNGRDDKRAPTPVRQHASLHTRLWIPEENKKYIVNDHKMPSNYSLWKKLWRKVLISKNPLKITI